MDLVSEERLKAEEQANGISDKLERDIAEILEAFEDYKQRTGSSPEKVQELKHGMVSLQETLHQIMNTNSELNKINSKLEDDVNRLTIENLTLSEDKDNLILQLDNSLVDLPHDTSSTDLHSENQLLQNQILSLNQRTTRLEKLERDNTILKNKVRKMKEMLREKEDELINLTESAENKEELTNENSHLKKMITNFKQKLDRCKETNESLKDKVREMEESRFMASTPNHSPGRRTPMSMSDEVEPIRTESSDPRRLAADSRDSNGPSLRSQSLISMAASQVSSFETVSLSERCKTLDIELSDLRDRYKILQETHDSEQNKAHEMSDALRNSVKLLKGYIDRSGDVKGERMIELQDQLEEQRSFLAGMAEQFRTDLPGSGEYMPDRTSLASGSTVCLDPEDNQLI